MAQQNGPGAQRRLRSAWAQAQSDQTLPAVRLNLATLKAHEEGSVLSLRWTHVILLVLSCFGSLINFANILSSPAMDVVLLWLIFLHVSIFCWTIYFVLNLLTMLNYPSVLDMNIWYYGQSTEVNKKCTW